jgi:hypothetical protein
MRWRVGYGQIINVHKILVQRLVGRDNMEDTGIYDTLTLTGIFQEQSRRMWIDFRWPRIGTSCHLLLTC